MEAKDSRRSGGDDGASSHHVLAHVPERVLVLALVLGRRWT